MSEETKEEKKGLLHKDNVQMLYLLIGIIVGLMSLIFMFGEKFGILEQKTSDTKEIVVRIEQGLGEVKSEFKQDVKVVNQKIDTLIERTAPTENKNVVYTERTDYSESGAKKAKTVYSTVPVEKLPKSKEEVAPVQVEAEPEEETGFAVSSKYEKKEEAKKKVNKALKYVPAVFYGDQQIEDNSTVAFRFNEAVEIGSNQFSRNTVFYGEAKKMSGKYKFTISQIEGNSVTLSLYDVNKMEGINVSSMYKDGQKILLAYE